MDKKFLSFAESDVVGASQNQDVYWVRAHGGGLKWHKLKLFTWSMVGPRSGPWTVDLLKIRPRY